MPTLLSLERLIRRQPTNQPSARSDRPLVMWCGEVEVGPSTMVVLVWSGSCMVRPHLRQGDLTFKHKCGQ